MIATYGEVEEKRRLIGVVFWKNSLTSIIKTILNSNIHINREPPGFTSNCSLSMTLNIKSVKQKQEVEEAENGTIKHNTGEMSSITSRVGEINAIAKDVNHTGTISKA